MILKSIIGTFSNKLLGTILSFVLVVVSSQVLGASGKGEISLFIANIVLVQHFGNLVSGTSIVYLTPRIKPVLLLIPAYAWSVLSSVVVVFTLHILGYAKDEWIWHLFILSLVYNLMSTNYMVLLGREKVKSYNILTLLVVIFTLLYFVGSYLFLSELSPIDYIYGLYVAYGMVFILSFIFIRNEFTSFSFSVIRGVLKELFSYGFTAQLSNIVTFINYRFSYYVLNELFDSSVVGVFSVGVAISEAMWLMSKSVALVQYTKIVNETDVEKAQQMTFKMAKFSFWITSIFILVMILMPDLFYSLVFGAEFIESKYVIYSLALGILSIATSTTFSHYFGGIGKFSVNNIASVLGLVFTMSLTYFLAKNYGMIGAGVSASISYFMSATYLFIRFKKESNFKLSYLIPNSSDFNKIKGFLSKK